MKRYARVPFAVYEIMPTLSPTAQRLLLGLCRFMGRDGRAWPALRTLMKTIGLKNKRSAHRALRDLEEIGLLRIERSRGRHANVYSWAIEQDTGDTLFDDDEQGTGDTLLGDGQQGIAEHSTGYFDDLEQGTAGTHELIKEKAEFVAGRLTESVLSAKFNKAVEAEIKKRLGIK